MADGRSAVLAVLVIAAACSRASTPSTAGDASPSSTASAPRASLGNVMAGVARRFELAGRAAAANRFELAEFEADELGELFEDDVPAAELPREGPTAHIPAMARAFAETSAPALRRAAAAKDRNAFAAAFRNASAACNACHQAAEKGFIQVPAELGKTVPELDPLPAPAVGAR